MKNILKKIIMPAILIMLVTFPACIGDNFEFDKLSTKIQLQSNWSFPIAYGTLTIDDLVELADSMVENYLVPNDSNLVIFRLQDTMISQTAEELITLKNQTFTMQFNKADYDNAGGFINNTVVINKDETEYPFGVVLSQLLDSMVFHSTRLRIRINSNMPNKGQLIMTFPALKKDGNTYVRSVNIEPVGNTFSYDYTYTDLQGYTLDLTKAHEGVNSLFINYTLLLKDDGAQPFNPENNIDIQIDFEDNVYSWLYGYAGIFESEIGPSAISLGFFDSFNFGSFYIEAPIVSFIITNSFGIPIKYGFDYVNVYNKRLDKTDPLTGVPYFNINPGFLIQPTNSNPLIETRDTLQIFGQTTNLPSLLYDLPSSVEYAIKISLNDPETGTQRNFMGKDSKVLVVSQLDLPFWGRTPKIGFVDTADFKIDLDSALLDYIKNVQVTLDIANGFPHDISIQGILTDEYGTHVDSIFGTPESQIIIKSGKIVNDRINQQTGKTKKTTVLDFSKKKFDKWKNAKFIIIKAQYNTTLPSQSEPQKSVLYYRDYGIDVRITAKAEVEIDEHL